jgi:leader peptidase (prepilin peptidase)/N-methyltransferase
MESLKALETTIALAQAGIYILIFIVGACIGSFLNVCILRLPAGESIVKHDSHCMTCGEKIKRYDLIPIVSYIILRGKCRHCGSKISPRYMIVELLTGIIFVLMFLTYYMTVYGFIFPLLVCLMLSTVIIVAFEDLDTQTMSVSVLIWMGIFSVATTLYTYFARPLTAASFSLLTGVTLSDRIIGLFSVSIPMLLIGFVITPLCYIWFISPDHKERRKLRRRLKAGVSPYEHDKVTSALGVVEERIQQTGIITGFGMGDIILMACAGLMFGYKAAVVAVFIGIVIGAVAGIILSRRDTSGGRGMKFAFGPYLSIGIVLSPIFGNFLWDAYFRLF